MEGTTCMANKMIILIMSDLCIIGAVYMYVCLCTFIYIDIYVKVKVRVKWVWFWGRLDV